jgi:hypothetical protein
MFHRMPLWQKGAYTIKAPLHFSDLAQAIVNSLNIEDAKGTVYEAYGYAPFANIFQR